MFHHFVWVTIIAASCDKPTDVFGFLSLDLVEDLDWDEYLSDPQMNETGRQTIRERALQDESGNGRSLALHALAHGWPDETTRGLLAQRAVQDENYEPRRAALEALAEKWPDETTRALLAQRAVQDPSDWARGMACSALGKMHSEFGRILPTRDLEGRGPYLDPLEPIPRDHIEQAAERAGVHPDDIDAQVASLSAHLGWDITRGAKPSGPTSKAKRKRRRR